MPRPASIAIAGYFPTPENLLPQIAALVDTTPAYQPRISWLGYRGAAPYPTYGKYVLLDPCAGDGTALVKLAQHWFPPSGPITNPRWDEDARKMVASSQGRYTVPATATVNHANSYSHSGPQVTVLGCEMEKERANRLGAKLRHELDYLSGKAFHADALTLSCKVGSLDLKGVSILYLNPPYSPDKVYGRLEQHFLEHYTPALIPGQGVLIFLVPHYALTASARYLAQHYEEIKCYRFPKPDFEQFGQVVLVARRAPVEAEEGSDGMASWLWQIGAGDNATANNHPVVKTILEWAEYPENLPILGEAGTTSVVKLAEQQQAGITLEEAKLDIPAMLKLAPLWQSATSSTNNTNNGSGARAGAGANLLSAYGPARELGLDKTIGDLVGQPYPVAAPPKPAHLAMALASGIFNGKRITPDDPQGTGLPDLLVKGVFSRDFKTVSTNTNKDGEVTSSVQVQQPSLKVVVLSLSTSEYHEIKGLGDSAAKTSDTAMGKEGDGTQPTDNNSLDLEALVEQAVTEQANAETTSKSKVIVNVAELSLLDLLNYYGSSLTALMAEQFPALHQPANPAHQLVLPALPRRLFKVQEQAVMALLKLLGGGVNPFVVGQPGTGKTTISLMIMAALSEAHHAQTITQLKKLGHLNTQLKPVKRALVVCPPINVPTWAVEITAVLPGAKVVVVESVSDLAVVDNDNNQQEGQSQNEGLAGAGLTIYLLSREDAKLGHGWRSGAYEVELKRQNKTTGKTRTYRDLRCPRCGTTIEEKAERLVKGRLRCDHSPLVALDSTARLVEKLAALLAKLPGEALKETKADRLLQMLWSSHRYLSNQREKLNRAAVSSTTNTAETETDEIVDAGAGSGSSEHRLDELVVNHLLSELVELILATYQQHGTDAHKRIATLGSALVNLAWGLNGSGAGLNLSGLPVTLAQLADRLYRQSLAIEEGAKAKVATTNPASSHSHKDGANETGKGIRQLALELLLNVSLHRDAKSKSSLAWLEHEDDQGVEAIEAKLRREYYADQRRLWDELEQTRNWLVGAANGRTSIIGTGYGYSYIGWKVYTRETATGQNGSGSGQPQWVGYGHEWGNLAAVGSALKELVAVAQFKRGAVCGEVLYQAAPKPRRLSLAKFISRNRRRFFDLLVIDELQEYANSGTAQTKAAHRLVDLPGVPAIGLSGSLTNGYASSLFATMWAFSEHFRREFGRDDKQMFVTRYGYRKQLVAAGGDGGSGGSNRQVLSYGSVSDRETEVQEDGVIRQLGEAPGVLPLFVLRYLLPVAVMVQKRELELELPPVTERPVLVEFDQDNEQDQQLYRAYVDLRNTVVNQVKQDRFNPTLAGKLWGAVTELPGYLDLCHVDTGNRLALAAVGKATKQAGDAGEDENTTDQNGNRYVISYPESCGGRVIAVGETFPADYITPKERWLLATLKSELAAGRNIMVFLRHTGFGAGKNGGGGVGLAGRLKRLIEQQTGEQVAVLASDKVSTAKRQDWLSREVIGKGRRILLLNPKTVKTGLNNLVAFNTAVWFELDYEPITYIQGNGRLDRPNQTRDVRIFFPVYRGTAQEIALSHLANKVKASLQVDGLDVVSALEAAGAGDSDQTAMQTVMNLGRAIYEKLVG